MNSKRIIEINLVMVLMMALSGIYFGIIGNSSAILTDGIVSLVIFLSSSLGIYIHTILNHNNDYLYPFGKWRFEYIYNLLRLIVMLIIIGYSLIEASLSIYNYLTVAEVHSTINLSSVILYFPLKLTIASCSLIWLRTHKRDLDDEYYQVERDSVFVDMILTLAILIGLTLFTKIDSIAQIADKVTLLIVAIILLITIISELKHLIYIIIGRRIYTELEANLMTALSQSAYTITDIHIEKFGIVYIVFVTCSFTGAKTLEQLEALEQQIGTKLTNLEITRYRVELNFKSE